MCFSVIKCCIYEKLSFERLYALSLYTGSGNLITIFSAMIDSPEDENKFKILYKMYRSMMYNQAYQILNDKQLAEDAVQNAFIMLTKNLQKILDVNCNKTRNFLIIIVRNESLKIYNIRKGYDEDSLNELIIPDYCDVQTAVESKDEQERIFRIIKGMSRSYSDILMLKYRYQLDDKEIAETLGITIENVRVRMHRAKKQLKALLTEEEIK